MIGVSVVKNYLKIPLYEQLNNEQINEIIEQLKNGKFSNIENRIEFLKLILPLALSTDKRARKIIKAMGDLMTTLGEEMISSDEEENTIEEPEIIDENDIDIDKEEYYLESKIKKMEKQIKEEVFKEKEDSSSKKYKFDNSRFEIKRKAVNYEK